VLKVSMANHSLSIKDSPGDSVSTERVTITTMSREMIPEVRKIHYEAFAGYMNTRLGASYIEAFLAWFLTAEGAIALVALDREKKVLGYVFGAPIDYGPGMNRDLIRVAAASVLMRPWLFFSGTFWTIIAGRLKSYFGLSPTRESRFQFPEPAMSLIAIGVAPSTRGKKVGLCLLRAFEDKAREMRIRSLQLTVYSNNVVARKLYETNNWTRLQGENGENSVIEYVRVITDDANQEGPISAAQT
jgi:ribosomal protein S18 acetylase RimI-like enzyme